MKDKDNINHCSQCGRYLNNDRDCCPDCAERDEEQLAQGCLNGVD